MLLEQMSDRLVGSEPLLVVVELEMALRAADEHNRMYRCWPHHDSHMLHKRAASHHIAFYDLDTAYRLARCAVSWAAVKLARQIRTDAVG